MLAAGGIVGGMDVAAKPCTGTTQTGERCRNSTSHPTGWCGQCANPPAALAAYAPAVASVAAAGPGPDPLAAGAGDRWGAHAGEVAGWPDDDLIGELENPTDDLDRAAVVLVEGAARGLWPQVTLNWFGWAESFGGDSMEELSGEIGDPDHGGARIAVYDTGGDGLRVYDRDHRGDLYVGDLPAAAECADADTADMAVRYAFESWSYSISSARHDLYTEAVQKLSASTTGRAAQVASDPSTDPETLERLVRVGSPEARAAALANPNLPAATRARIGLEAD